MKIKTRDGELVSINTYRAPNEQFKTYDTDVFVEANEHLRIEFLDGTIAILHGGYIIGDKPTDVSSAAITVYQNPNNNPVLSWERQ